MAQEPASLAAPLLWLLAVLHLLNIFLLDLPHQVGAAKCNRRGLSCPRAFPLRALNLLSIVAAAEIFF